MQVLWEDHRNDLFVNGFGTINPMLQPSQGPLTSHRSTHVCRWQQMGLVYVFSSTRSTRSLIRPRKVLDPTGAILVRIFRVLSPLHPFLAALPASQIGVGISCAWIHRIYREFELLAGKSAPHDFIQLLVYKAMTFSNEIEKIDTVRAYHVGRCPTRSYTGGRFLTGLHMTERPELFR